MEEEVLRHYTVVQLKELLRERGLRVSGRKAELIERLVAFEPESLPETPSTPPSASQPPRPSLGRSSAKKAAALSPRVEPESPYRSPRRRSRLSTPVQASANIPRAESPPARAVEEEEEQEEEPDLDGCDEEEQLDRVLNAIQTKLDSARAVEEIKEQARMEMRENWGGVEDGYGELDWELDVAAAQHAARLIHHRAAHHWRAMLVIWIASAVALWATFDLWSQLLPPCILEASRTSWLGLFTMLFLPYFALTWWGLLVHKWAFSTAFAEHKDKLPNATVQVLTARLCEGLVRHQQRSNAALFLVGQFAAWGCRAFAAYTVLYVVANFYLATIAVRARME